MLKEPQKRLMPKDSSKDRDPAQPTALTSIRRGIHCAATTDATDVEDELRENEIQHFLDTLAEVALAVARRRQQIDQ